jgi:hypothetical protein
MSEMKLKKTSNLVCVFIVFIILFVTKEKTYALTIKHYQLSPYELSIPTSRNFSNPQDFTLWITVENESKTTNVLIFRSLFKLYETDFLSPIFDDYMGDNEEYWNIHLGPTNEDTFKLMFYASRDLLDGTIDFSDGDKLEFRPEFSLMYSENGYSGSITNVPAPSALLLVGSGLAGVVGLRRKRLLK